MLHFHSELTSFSLKEITVIIQKRMFLQNSDIRITNSQRKVYYPESPRGYVQQLTVKTHTHPPLGVISHALWLPTTVAFSGKIKGAVPPIQSHHQPKITVSILPYLAHISSPSSFSKRHVVIIRV